MIDTLLARRGSSLFWFYPTSRRGDDGVSRDTKDLCVYDGRAACYKTAGVPVLCSSRPSSG